jgi:tetraacyldisaccharide 4'-kinase
MIQYLNPYALIIEAKNFLYDEKFLKQIHTKTKIISIGNLNTGGSGKTPLIQYIVNHFFKNKNVLIVCKSYKAKLKLPQKVDLDVAQAVEIFGDEACLLQQLLPVATVWSGPTKSQTVVAALAHSNNFDVIIIDDGFSHRQIFRHKDVVLIDASQKISLYKILPFGFMRETWKTLTRAHLVILTKTQGVTSKNKKFFTDKILPHQKNLISAEYQPHLVTENKKIFLITGIGNPQKLYDDLVFLGFNIVSKMFYSDHYAFPESEQLSLLHQCSQFVDAQPVMTAKDYIKITNQQLKNKIKVIELSIHISESDKGVFYDKVLS